MTEVWLDSSTDLAELAADVIRRTSLGEVVLVPTETQYGLCCNAEDSTAIRRLSAIKDRSLAQPSSLFVRDWKHASSLVNDVQEGVERFLDRFWPGPLTVVCKSSRSDWPGIVSPGGTIGFRCSPHPLLGHILSHDNYLTATSANLHGSKPSVDPDVLINWLANDVELLIFDPNIQEFASASTVVDISGVNPVILREGRIKAIDIETAWIEEMQK
jgi:tRNA threonylcarbamoyl adenosine modification protein (Sua5/YciO/YrdC/YwlC family)